MMFDIIPLVYNVTCNVSNSKYKSILNKVTNKQTNRERERAGRLTYCSTTYVHHNHQVKSYIGQK